MKNILSALLISTAVATAQPALTTITDTIYNSIGGTPFNGSVTVQGPNVTGPASVPVLGISRTIDIVNGVLSFAVVPNQTASPASTYSLTFSNGDVKTCNVPSSGSPLNLAQANCINRSTQPAAPGVVALSQIASGGATQGQALLFNGAQWAPGSALPSGITGVQGTGSKLMSFTGGTPADRDCASFNGGTLVDSSVPCAPGFAGEVGTIENAPTPGTGPSASQCNGYGIYFFTDAPAYSYGLCKLNAGDETNYWRWFIGGQAVLPPDVYGSGFANFVWTNQGGADYDDQPNGVWTFHFPNHGNTSNSLNVLDTSGIPASSIWRFSAVEASNGSTDPSVGVSLREASSGKLLTIGVNTLTGGTCPAAPCLAVTTWTSVTGTPTVHATSQGFAAGITAPWTVQVLVASGVSGNVTINWSPDGGVTYLPLYQAAKNSIFTTGPTSIGVFGDNNSNGKDIYLILASIN